MVPLMPATIFISLFSLQVLNLFWYYLIMKILIRSALNNIPRVIIFSKYVLGQLLPAKQMMTGLTMGMMRRELRPRRKTERRFQELVQSRFTCSRTDLDITSLVIKFTCVEVIPSYRGNHTFFIRVITVFLPWLELNRHSTASLIWPTFFSLYVDGVTISHSFQCHHSELQQIKR